MTPLTKDSVEAAIKAITGRLTEYELSPGHLTNFRDNPIDRRYMQYLNGLGGFYCKFLALLVRHLAIRNIVELGNREGLSTLSIYDALPKDGSLTSIDIVRNLRYCPDEMFTSGRVNFIFGDVCDLSIFDNQYPFNTELLFTDTIHYDYQLRNEFSIYQHFLADSALIAIDDINLNDKRKLFDELPFPKWDLTELCHVSGWGLVLFERTQDSDEQERLLKAFQASAKMWCQSCQALQRRAEKTVVRSIRNQTRTFLHRHPALYNGSLALRGLWY